MLAKSVDSWCAAGDFVGDASSPGAAHPATANMDSPITAPSVFTKLPLSQQRKRSENERTRRLQYETTLRVNSLNTRNQSTTTDRARDIPVGNFLAWAKNLSVRLNICACTLCVAYIELIHAATVTGSRALRGNILKPG